MCAHSSAKPHLYWSVLRNVFCLRLIWWLGPNQRPLISNSTSESTAENIELSAIIDAIGPRIAVRYNGYRTSADFHSDQGREE